MSIKERIDFLVDNKNTISSVEFDNKLIELMLDIDKIRGSIVKMPIYIYSLGMMMCRIEEDLKTKHILFHFDKGDEMPLLEVIPNTGCFCKEGDICMKTDLKELFKCKNFKNFVDLNPNIKNAFKNNKIFYLTTKPHYEIQCKLNIFEKNLDNLLSLISIQHQAQKKISNDYRIILQICLFDFLISNYFYACMYKKYYANGLFELYNVEKYEYDIEFVIKYSINPMWWYKCFSKACRDF